MKFIAHRVNVLNAELAEQIFAEVDGIEFDLRSSGNQILVVHDPFQAGQPFDEFIHFLRPDKMYIVNIKTEGIEERVIQMMDALGLHSFFLLNCGMPSIVRLARTGERRMAIRFSEYESIESVEKVEDLVSWVWVDCFSYLPLNPIFYNHIQRMGLNICLVSPELQGKPEKIEEYRNWLERMNMDLDAVCSKLNNLPLWME